jgi:hypothetical protein
MAMGVPDFSPRFANVFVRDQVASQGGKQTAKGVSVSVRYAAGGTIV